MGLIKDIVNNLTKTKTYLILANVLLVFFLILLSNLGILPMKLGDFVFFSFIYLIFALYRPGWSFLFFIGTITLENVNLVPESVGIFVRPYQIIGALTIISLLFRYFTKRLNFELVKLKWFDYVIGIFVFAGFLSSFFALDKSVAFKQSAILLTFAALYWLVRNYIQTFDDLKRIAPFFLSSGVIVIFYGIWQNVRFLHGANSFETMLGRPNATFTEPDWLGIFLVLLIAVIYSIIYWIITNNQETKIKQSPITNHQSPNLFLVTCYLLLVTTFVLLIITVSRSAWLGAGFVTLVFLKASLTNFSFRFSNWQYKHFSHSLVFIAIAIITSIGIVYIFHLTNFQLFNRAQSTTTGTQEVTVVCPSKSDFDKLPQKVDNVSELADYNCRHINLEEIISEKEKGNFVGEISRTDPNISVRSDIYRKSIEQIEENPIFGIGWGNIMSILGKDERGTGLNSSNIILEVWLGSGILGILAFLTIWVYIFTKSVIYVLRENAESKIIRTFILLGFFALLIPNLFNAGAYLGILWVWFAAAQVESSK